MIVLVDERNGIADVLLETDLPVLSILTQSCLIFTGERLLLVVLALKGTAFEGKLKMAGE